MYSYQRIYRLGKKEMVNIYHPKYDTVTRVDDDRIELPSDSVQRQRGYEYQVIQTSEFSDDLVEDWRLV